MTDGLVHRDEESMSCFPTIPATYFVHTRVDDTRSQHRSCQWLSCLLASTQGVWDPGNQKSVCHHLDLKLTVEVFHSHSDPDFFRLIDHRLNWVLKKINLFLFLKCTIDWLSNNRKIAWQKALVNWLKWLQNLKKTEPKSEKKVFFFNFALFAVSE